MDSDRETFEGRVTHLTLACVLLVLGVSALAGWLWPL